MSDLALDVLTPSLRSCTARAPGWQGDRGEPRSLVLRKSAPLLNSTPPSFEQGVLAGFDQKSNVVLSESKERVYSMDEGVEEIPLGLYLVKGDMMYAIHFRRPSLQL